jgi:hypothetical protein
MTTFLPRSIVQNSHWAYLTERLLDHPVQQASAADHNCVRFTQYGFFTTFGSFYAPEHWQELPAWMWYWKAIICLLIYSIPERLKWEVRNLLNRTSPNEPHHYWAYWGKGQIVQWMIFNLGLMFGYHWNWLGTPVKSLERKN